MRCRAEIRSLLDSVVDVKSSPACFPPLLPLGPLPLLQCNAWRSGAERREMPKMRETSPSFVRSFVHPLHRRRRRRRARPLFIRAGMRAIKEEEEEEDGGRTRRGGKGRKGRTRRNDGGRRGGAEVK